MRKSQPRILSAPDRERLENFISTGEHKARHVQHAQVILRASEGWHDEKIAQAIGLSAKTVLQIRHRYLKEGIEAVLSDKARSGRPVKFEGTVKAVLVATACSEAPSGHSH
jgi:transposase